MRSVGLALKLAALAISIHALHYRVRFWCTLRTFALFSISIHALHYRVRSKPNDGGISPQYHFNPRTPLQSAIFRTSCGKLWVSISIHALHYRVRSWLASITTKSPDISIHALHYRVRLGDKLIIPHATIFQSTHSITECDRRSCNATCNVASFQSTHSITECDGACISISSSLRISIHALHYRVRFHGILNIQRRFIISIHALHYRVRLRVTVDLAKASTISIHALHYRVRSASISLVKPKSAFQSTHSITECD